jgi:hypothetical protein
LKIKYLFFIIASVVVALANCKTAAKPAACAVATPPDALARARAKDTASVRKEIAGRENRSNRVDCFDERPETLKPETLNLETISTHF